MNTLNTTLARTLHTLALAAAVTVAAQIATIGAAGTAEARVETHFSSERGVTLDDVIVDSWALAERAARRGEDASIDVAVFAFTTQELADELLRLAKDNPTLRVRLLTDLSQVSQSSRHMSPYVEFAAAGQYTDACRVFASRDRADCRARLEVLLEGALLDNVEVSYKYYDAYVYGPGGRIVLEHRLSKLMHHKFVVVNGGHLVTGSYNFSLTASRSNYENLMVFSGSNERDMVADYAAEFSAMWNDASIVMLGADVREWRRALLSSKYEAIED